MKQTSSRPGATWPREIRSTHTHPAVTVAICLFNSAKCIDETLDSVFAQTFDDYELVLVDDGSTDGCADSIERRLSDRKFRLIRQTHRGLSYARRASIANARGEFIAFLDHDDLWAPDKLARQMAAAQADSSAALFFSDCEYVDEYGNHLGLISDQYGLATLDLTETNGYTELLRRGCFVWQSTVLARAAALRSVEPFDPKYPYIADYDTWLRMARRYRLHYTPEVLAQWRVHAGQFTQRCPEVTLSDHRALLGPLYRTESIPRSLRIVFGDRLLGQHRVSCRRLLEQKRFWLAGRACFGMLSYPDRLLAFVLGAIAEAPAIGSRLLSTYKWARSHFHRFKFDRSPAEITPSSGATAAPTRRPHVWVDGSVLDQLQTGYFNLTTQLIRRLATEPCEVHVITSREGRRALTHTLGPHIAGIHFEPADGRASRSRPRGRPPHPNTLEVLIWHGRFRWRGSQRIAIIPDLTTRMLPQLHTAENVADFEKFLEYAERRAEWVLTLSASSRRDIIDRLSVFPDRVSVLGPQLSPAYLQPELDEATPARYQLTQPYLLFVGCIEPRKNLRRLVEAFELLQGSDLLHGHVLALAGPKGWDEAFEELIAKSPASPRIKLLGFVPGQDLPSLYHYAAAVVYPSLYEGFGFPVLEAMSCSAVVIASDTSSLPEVLGDGIMCDPHSSQAIADAILRAVAMPEVERVAYRQSNRARAEYLVKRANEAPVLPGMPSPARLS